MEKNVNTKNKSKIKNMKKFVTFMISLIIIAFIVVLVVLLNNKVVEIDENTNISELNIKKYSSAIKEEYELEGKKDKFIEDSFAVQNAVGVYLLENSTVEDGSFNELLEKINKILDKKDWSEMKGSLPTYWNGKWSVNDKGNVKFKFASKEIEPSWVSDIDAKVFIELN
ncbi:MAG: hypothetical protein PHP54_01925 [Clostridia bacterium]|nr:hypothetical protein [Clostridia bacterium]